MNALKTYLSKRVLAFRIALIYVGIGTLAVCSVSPSDPLYGEWTTTALLVTWPVSVFSFAYRYAGSQSLFPVLLIQSVVFILTFVILGAFIKQDKL